MSTAAEIPNPAAKMDDSKPEIEVVAKPKRRFFTAAYKRRIVEEASKREFGEVASLLRREGLYTSQLAKWRKQHESYGNEGLTAKKRGRKPKDPQLKEMEKLKRQNEWLQKKLNQAELIIEVQKKVSALRAQLDRGGLMDAVLELQESGVPTAKACHVFAVSRATFYRHHGPDSGVERPEPKPNKPPIPRTSHRALSKAERPEVLDTLHSKRFVDAAPAQVCATLLEEGKYLCSTRTMYRILADAGEIRERRNQRRHPIYNAPSLQATAPNQVWTWDITKLKGPTKWTHLHLYVILDIFSRYVVGWMVADRECSELAKTLIQTSCERHDVTANQLVLHADRGPSMTSKVVAQLLIDLGVDKSHSRPRVSNDNAFSEAQFKTLKYHRDFPGSFDSIENAQTFLRPFFDSYNYEHKHSGIALMTPATVHHGEVATVLAKRQHALDAAYARTPERFARPPQAAAPPQTVYLGEVSGAEVITLEVAHANSDSKRLADAV